MSQERLSLALSAELKAQVQAEADARGVKLGVHARDIIGQHFDGQGSSRVDEQLAELTEAIDRLRERGTAEGGRVEVTELSFEVSRLREEVAALAGSLHFALRIIAYQDPRPNEEQFAELERQFETIARNFHARD